MKQPETFKPAGQDARPNGKPSLTEIAIEASTSPRAKFLAFLDAHFPRNGHGKGVVHEKRAPSAEEGEIALR